MFRTCVLAGLVAIAPAVHAQKVSPEILVQGHVEQTLGSSDRSALAREVRGSCRLTTVTGAGSLDGPFTMTSTADSSNFTLQFKNESYEGETFKFDDNRVDIAFAQPRISMRSAMGLFVSGNRVIMSNGLFGGVLNARWPLFDAALREAKLSYEGKKKLDGRELHRLRYRAKRDQADLSILLYFEPDTYRHVASVYETSRAQSLGPTMEASSQRSDQRLRLQESFSNFETQDGITVPKTWLVRYSRSGDTTAEWKYECTVRTVGRKTT